VAGLLVAAVMLAAVGAWAQSAATGDVYRVGVGDVLRLAVPQAAELDGEETVQTDGTVYVNQVGKVSLAGLTIAEAEEMLLRRLRLIDPSITEVVLSVMEYNALRIFALGALNSPGSYTFQAPPTLWEVLRAAGGPGENASLANCRVISIEDGRPVSRTVNLSGYLTGVDFPSDVLNGGDTLVVPLVADGVVGVPTTMGVQVFGGVVTPTTVPINEPTDLLSVLMLAGSTSETAELHKIDWVHRGVVGQQGAVATRVDMRQFLEQGLTAGNPMVHPGDVVYVARQRPNWFQQNLPIILASLTTMTTLLLTYDRLAR
jgi:protein involved in polysaccharide export with SLBB domain